MATKARAAAYVTAVQRETTAGKAVAVRQEATGGKREVARNSRRLLLFFVAAYACAYAVHLLRSSSELQAWFGFVAGALVAVLVPIALRPLRRIAWHQHDGTLIQLFGIFFLGTILAMAGLQWAIHFASGAICGTLGTEALISFPRTRGSLRRQRFGDYLFWILAFSPLLVSIAAPESIWLSAGLLLAAGYVLMGSQRSRRA